MKWIEGFFKLLSIDSLHEFVLPALTAIIILFWMSLSYMAFFRPPAPDDEVFATILKGAETLASLAVGYWFRASIEPKREGGESS